jgi:hypothetical protein
MGNYQSQNSSSSRRQGSFFIAEHCRARVTNNKKEFFFNRCIYQKHETLNSILMQHSFEVARKQQKRMDCFLGLFPPSLSLSRSV